MFNRRKLLLIIIVLNILIIISFIIHMPIKVQKTLFNRKIIDEPIYLDVLSSDYDRIFLKVCEKPYLREEIWNNKTIAIKYCMGEDFYPIPYIDYKFGHAPLTGSIWFVLTYITYIVTPRTDTVNIFVSDHGFTIFYILYSLYVSISLTIGYYYLYKLFSILNIKNMILYMSSTLLSTTIIYSIYGWEPHAFLLFSMFIYYYLLEDYKKTYLALGLYTSANPFGFVLLFLILYNVLIREKPKPSKDLVYLLNGLIPYIILSIMSIKSVLNLFTWFINGFCNNCIYLFIVNDASSQILKGLFIIIWTIVITIYLSFEPLNNTILHRYAYIVLFISYAYLFNLEPVPQTMILILPFLSPLYIVYKQLKPLIPHYIIDTANALIIVLWFRDLELRKTLSFMGLPLEHNPFSLESPVQWIAQIRNIIFMVEILILTTLFLKIRNNNG